MVTWREPYEITSFVASCVKVTHNGGCQGKLTT